MNLEPRTVHKVSKKMFVVSGPGWMSNAFSTKKKAEDFVPDPSTGIVAEIPHPRAGVQYVVQGDGWRSQKFLHQGQALGWLEDRPELNPINMGPAEPPDSVEFEETTDSEAEDMVEKVRESIQRSAK